jgi:hypothetical protein
MTQQNSDGVTVVLELDRDMLATVDDRAAKAGRDRQEMLHLLLRIGLSASVNPMEPPASQP